jgi:hypothetical protein
MHECQSSLNSSDKDRVKNQSSDKDRDLNESIVNVSDNINYISESKNEGTPHTTSNLSDTFMSERSDESPGPNQSNERINRKRPILYEYNDLKIKLNKLDHVNIPHPLASLLTFNYFLGDPLIELAVNVGLPSDDVSPSSYKEAMASMEKEQWEKAINEELNSISRLKVWEKSPKPFNKKLISSRWVFKKKYNPDGTFKYKARLVAKGFMQIEGDDYDVTFSPVVRLTSVRLILSIAANYGLQVHQMDVDSAFLNADLDNTEIYLSTPEGLHGLTADECLHLKKALYGLKQAPREWNSTINNYLTEKGFTRLDSDSCIYVRGDITKGTYIIISIYVDDIMIAGQNIKEINRIKGEFNTKWKMKDMGPISLILGCQVNQTSTMITVKQSYFVKDTINIYQEYMPSGSPKTVPMSPEVNLSVEECPTSSDEIERMKLLPYRSVIGKLLWLSLCTRPDIMYATIQCSKFSVNFLA